MRILPLVLLAAISVTAACVGQDDGQDLGNVVDGKGDGTLISVSVVLPAQTATPGVSNYTVHSTNDFDVALAYDGEGITKIIVSNVDTGASFESTQGPSPTVSVTAGGTEHAFKIRLENYGPELTAKLTVTAHGNSALPLEWSFLSPTSSPGAAPVVWATPSKDGDVYVVTQAVYAGTVLYKLGPEGQQQWARDLGPAGVPMVARPVVEDDSAIEHVWIQRLVCTDSVTVSSSNVDCTAFVDVLSSSDGSILTSFSIASGFVAQYAGQVRYADSGVRYDPIHHYAYFALQTSEKTASVALRLAPSMDARPIYLTTNFVLGPDGALYDLPTRGTWTGTTTTLSKVLYGYSIHDSDDPTVFGPGNPTTIASNLDNSSRLAVAPDGTLLILSTPYMQPATLQSLSSAGQVRWSQSLEFQPAGYDDLSTPGDGRVYLEARVNSAPPFLYQRKVFDLATGSILPHWAGTLPMIDVHGRYFTSDLDAQGAVVREEDSLGAPLGVYRQPSASSVSRVLGIGADGVIYVRITESIAGTVSTLLALSSLPPGN